VVGESEDQRLIGGKKQIEWRALADLRVEVSRRAIGDADLQTGLGSILREDLVERELEIGCGGDGGRLLRVNRAGPRQADRHHPSFPHRVALQFGPAVRSVAAPRDGRRRPTSAAICLLKHIAQSRINASK
jgi:hypothetical protein